MSTVPWLDNFIKNPSSTLLDDLLRNIASIGTLSGADSHALFLDDWIRAGVVKAEVVDEHLWWWMRIHWGEIETYSFRPWTEVAYLIRESPLPNSAGWLRQSLLDSPNFLLNLTNGPAHDPYSRALYAISRHQVDDSLLEFWKHTCSLKQNPNHFWRGSTGVRGIEEIPCSTDDMIIEGFQLWKKAIDSTTAPNRDAKRNRYSWLARSFRLMSAARRPSLKKDPRILALLF